MIYFCISTYLELFRGHPKKLNSYIQSQVKFLSDQILLEYFLMPRTNVQMWVINWFCLKYCKFNLYVQVLFQIRKKSFYLVLYKCWFSCFLTYFRNISFVSSMFCLVLLLQHCSWFFLDFLEISYLSFISVSAIRSINSGS